MPDINKYADWIVANQDKKGSEEFETVAAAYKELRTQPTAEAPTELTPDFTMGEQFTRGVERGAMRLGSTFGDILPAMAASAVGADEYAQRQLTEAAQTEEEIARRLAPQYSSYKDIGGVGDFVGYATETIGEQIPNLLAAIVPGVGGGALATRTALSSIGKGIAKEAAEKGLVGTAAKDFLAEGLKKAAPKVASAQSKGQLGGAFLGSYALNAPEVFQNIYQETGSLEPGVAALFSTASAALDSILPAKLANSLTGPAKLRLTEKILEKSGMDKGLLRSVTAGLASGVATEGATEGLQEGVSIAAERFVDENPELFGGKEFDRIVESMIRGSVAGGGFGTVGGATSRVQEQRARGQRLAEIDASRKTRDSINAEWDKYLNQFQTARTNLDANVAAQAKQKKQQQAEEAEETRKKEEADFKKGKPRTTPLTDAQRFLAEQRLAPDYIQKQFDSEKAAEAKRVAADQKDLEDLVAGEQKIQGRELAADQKDFETLVAGEQRLQGRELARQQKDFERLAATEQARQAKDLTALQKQQQAAPQATTEAVVEPTVRQEAPVQTAAPTAIPADKAGLRGFGKLFGIGPTATLLRETGPLAGKDITDPAQAVVVKEALENYAGKTKIVGAADKIAEYLARPEFATAAPAPAETATTAEPRFVNFSQAISEQAEAAGLTPEQYLSRQRAAQAQKLRGDVATERARPPRFEDEVADVIEKRSDKGFDEDAARVDELIASLPDRARTNAEIEILQAKRIAERVEVVEQEEIDLVADETQALLNLPLLLTEFRSLVRQQKSPAAAKKLVPSITEGATRIGFKKADVKALIDNVAKAPDAGFQQLVNELNQRGRREQAKIIQEGVIGKLPRKNKDESQAANTELAAKRKGEQEPDVQAQVEEEAALKKKEEAAEDARLAKLKSDLEAKGMPTEGLFGPVYKGKDLNETAVADLTAGRLNNTLKALEADASPKLRRVLQKLRSLNLKTKIVIGSVGTANAAGSYNPTTDTITLDPEVGLNEHTLLHETIHAAISKVLASPDLKITKDFTRFFNQVSNRLGNAYGAQNIQEFASELISNPEFQALLKEIKAPKSQSLFKRIMQAIAEFFGFKQNALDVGTKFVSDAIDISTGVEASPADQLFLIGGAKINSVVGGIGQAMPKFAGETLENTKNWFSTLKDMTLKEAAFGLLRLDNIRDMYGDKLPALKRILDAVEKRLGEQERRVNEANEKYKKFQAIEKKHPKQTATMGVMARDARLAKVDLVDPKFKPSAENQAEYNKLKAIYNNLPTEVQEMYATMRRDYDSTFNEYKAFLKANVSSALAAKLEAQFARDIPIVGYVPFLRYGDFWLEYTDASGERVVRAFRDTRERKKEIDRLKAQKINSTPYMNLDQIKYDPNQVPPTSFVGQIMADLSKGGAPQQQLDQVYQTYLALFPATSMMKRQMKADEVAGMETDMVSAYGDTMVRWSRHLTNAKYMPELNKALSQLAEEGRFADDTIQAAVNNVMAQSEFLRNPTYNNLVSGTTALSYFAYIAGNVSSAVINLTSIALMTLPLLGARFGYDAASSVLMKAGKTALNDWSTGEYKALYDTLMEHGQLQHTLAREILEGTRRTSGEFSSNKAKVMDFLSIPFAATEKYNRATTAIAAYEMALKGNAALNVKPMSKADAIQYALKTVKDVNTSGMAATSPRFMQGGAGRIMLTFKSFIWNSAYVVARSFVQATRDADPDVRRIAQRQLLGFYGMSAAVAGVGGLPFFGAAATLANMLNALMGDDDEPYDTKQWTREFTGELAYKGPLNYLTNLEIANRSSLANDLIFRDDPQGISEDGYTMTAIKTAAGPAGSVLMGVERGFDYMQRGEVVRAVEAAFPSFIRNALKGTRYFTEGALSLKGDPIDEDINAYNAVMQVFGFGPADLSSTYEQRSAAKNYERKVLDRKQRILDRWEMASESGDREFKAEVRKEFNNFRKNYPQLVDARTLDRSLNARRSAEKEIMLGMRWNKSLQPKLEEEFFSGLR